MMEQLPPHSIKTAEDLAVIKSLLAGIAEQVKPIEQIKTDIAVMRNQYLDICKDTEELKKKISGNNGNPGLEKTVAKIDDKVNQFGEKLGYVYWVVGAALLVLIGIVVKVGFDAFVAAAAMRGMP